MCYNIFVNEKLRNAASANTLLAIMMGMVVMTTVMTMLMREPGRRAATGNTV